MCGIQVESTNGNAECRSNEASGQKMSDLKRQIWSRKFCDPSFQLKTALRNSPKLTSGCLRALKSQPETSVRDFAPQLDPSLTRFEVARFG